MQEKKRRKKSPAATAIMVSAIMTSGVMFVEYLIEKDKREMYEAHLPLMIEAEEEQAQWDIEYSNILLGVFRLEGDRLEVSLIGPDGTVIKTGPNEYGGDGVSARVSAYDFTERGVYVAHADYILNTVTGEYYVERNPFCTNIKVDGIEMEIISFIKELDETEILFIQTDDQLYSMELDDIAYEIWRSDEEDGLGEIAIVNGKLVAIEY